MDERAKDWCRAAAVVALIAIPAACWWLCAGGAKKVSPVEKAGESTVAPAQALPPPVAKTFRQSEEPAYSPLADELHAERFDAAHDLEVLRGLIGQLTTTLRLAERPPLGDNADISAALTGKNRRRVVFVPPTHVALRGGLLVDRLGTPYHFHARSADAIDVRSAGSDRMLFTADDLVSTVGGGR
jgi:hypothetical protein